MPKTKLAVSSTGYVWPRRKKPLDTVKKSSPAARPARGLSRSPKNMYSTLLVRLPAEKQVRNKAPCFAVKPRERANGTMLLKSPADPRRTVQMQMVITQKFLSCSRVRVDCGGSAAALVVTPLGCAPPAGETPASARLSIT